MGLVLMQGSEKRGHVSRHILIILTKTKLTTKKTNLTCFVLQKYYFCLTYTNKSRRNGPILYFFKPRGEVHLNTTALYAMGGLRIVRNFRIFWAIRIIRIIRIIRTIRTIRDYGESGDIRGPGIGYRGDIEGYRGARSYRGPGVIGSQELSV